MDLNFNKVSYDGDLEDFSEEQLQELIREYATAQDSNVAEFEKAADALEGVDENNIEDFEDAREALIEDVTQAEAFSEVPVTAESLEDASFSDLQDWKDFVTEESTDSDGDGDGDVDFDDMGKKSPNAGGEDETSFADEELEQISGLNL